MHVEIVGDQSEKDSVEFSLEKIFGEGAAKLTITFEENFSG